LTPPRGTCHGGSHFLLLCILGKGITNQFVFRFASVLEQRVASQMLMSADNES